MFGFRKKKQVMQELSEEPDTDPAFELPPEARMPPKPIGEATRIVKLALDTIEKSSVSRAQAKASASRVVGMLHPMTAKKA